jgi:hypothetical protein
VGLSATGDLAFLHRLEEGGLGARSRSVDFIREKDLAENGAGNELEGPPLFPVAQDFAPRDISGHQIRGALHPPEIEPKEVRQGTNQASFSQARRAFHENMPAGDEDGDDPFDEVGLPQDSLLQGGPQGIQQAGCLLGHDCGIRF